MNTFWHTPKYSFVFLGTFLDVGTFVPGEAVLAPPSDVGHCQDPSQVAHKQQVSNTDHRQRT